MRITAIEEYGLRCLLTLARREQGEQISIAEIATIEGLSVPYVSKLLAILRRAELVSAARGRTGGFTLARDPRDVSLYEVLTALGGPLIDPEHCQKRSGQLDKCVHLNDCTIHDVLGGLAGYVQDFLSKTSLWDLASGHSRTIARRRDGELTIAESALESELKVKSEDDFDTALETISEEDVQKR